MQCIGERAIDWVWTKDVKVLSKINAMSRRWAGACTPAQWRDMALIFDNTLTSSV